MRLLALDTATRDSAVALLCGDQVLAEIREPAASHSRSLLPLIDRLLRGAGLEIRQVEAIGVGVGPGSFTGLRIGLSVAKTLAFGLRIPLAGVSSLRALAENGAGLGDWVCPALDALKGEVFSASYRVAQGRMDQVEPAAARDPEAWSLALGLQSGTRVVLGSGLLRYREQFESGLGPRLVVPAEPDAHRIRASALGRLAWQRLASGDSDDARTLEPLYCRLSEAELAQIARKERSGVRGS